VTVQLPLAGIDPPVRTICVEVEEETDPLVHVVAAPVCVMPVGKGSVTCTPVSVTVLPDGLVIVRVRVEVPPTAIGLVPNDLVMVGGFSTAIKALAVVPVPPLVELTVPVVFVFVPAVVLVTLPVMVQLLLVGIEAPLMLTELVPTPPPVNVAPEQLVVAAVEKVIPVGRVSLTATPVRATVLAAGLVIVMVIVEVPVFTAMLADPNDLVMVGAATAVKVAEAVVPVPPFVALTVPVVLALLPAVVGVTVTETEQLPLTGTLPPLRLMLVAFAFAVNVPPQLLVVVGELVTCRPEGNESLTATPVSAALLPAGLVMVIVSVEDPPTLMLVGAKLLVIVGGESTFNVAVALVPVPPFDELTLPVVLT